MAPVCGNRNKKGISDSKPLEQDELEIVQEEPQTSKDAEIEALRKERDVLIEALKNQQLRNRVEETDRNNGFENPFAKPSHRQQGGERHLVRASTLDPRCAKGPPNHRLTIPRSQDPQDHQASHMEFHRDGDYEGDVVFEHHRSRD
jgi:hypothetical protein